MPGTDYTAPYTDPSGTWRMADGTQYTDQARAEQDSAYRDLVNRLRLARLAGQGKPTQDGRPYRSADGQWFLGDGHPLPLSSNLPSDPELLDEANTLRLAFNHGREEREARLLLETHPGSLSDEQVRAVITVN